MNHQQLSLSIQQQLRQKEIVAEKECLDAPPLDFSFKNISDLEEIKQLQPRQGRRKEIKIEEEKREEIKNIQKEEDRKVAEIQEDQPAEGQQNGEVEEAPPEEKEVIKEKEKNINKKKEESKKSPEFLVIQASAASNLIVQQNIPLNSTSNKATGKNQENKNNLQQQCIKINRICVCVILSQNKLRLLTLNHLIRSLLNFYNIIDSVMFDAKRLQWIDISYNYLEALDYTFSDFPDLTTLYIHCNYIRDLNNLDQLQDLKKLKSITIHGNPIEQIPNVRLHIVGKLTNLRRIDSVLISKKEKDNSQVYLKQFKILPKLPDIVRRPPEQKSK